MMRSLFSGVSGLKNHQTRMDVIGNNISNVNTTGFKSSRVNFTDMLSQTLTGASAPQENQGGTNPKQIGLGSSVSAIDLLFTNGSVQSTGKNTDLCLSGNGLFVVSSDAKGTNKYYTRNGAFEFDAKGNYVQSGNGMYVLGWMATDDGELVTTGDTRNIIIPAGKSMESAASMTATYANNLNASPVGYEIASVTATYDDGKTETLTSYPRYENSLKLNSGKTIALDDTAAYDFTTGDDVAGKVLHTETISSVTATGAGKVDLTLVNGDDAYSILRMGTNTYTAASDGPMTGTTDYPIKITYDDGAGGQGTVTVIGGPYQVDGTVPVSGNDYTILKMEQNYPIDEKLIIQDLTSGTYAYGDSYKITGTIENRGVTTTGDDAGKTFLTVKLTAPAEAADTIVTVRLPKPPGDYYDGEEVSFNLKISQIDAEVGAKVNCKNGETYTTCNYDGPITVDEPDEKYAYKGRDTDGTVTDVIVEKKPAKSLLINTKDGGTVTASPDEDYTAGKMYYPSVVTTVSVYDSLGGSHDVPVLFTKTDENTWKLSLSGGGDTYTIDESDGSTTVVTLTSKTLTFNSAGAYTDGDGTLSLKYGNGAADQTTSLNLSGLTQYIGSSTINAATDGHAAGNLSAVSIDTSGIITGTYTNGVKRQEAQVAVAQFYNSSGLTKTGDSLYQESNNSGKANIKTAADLGVSLTPSALEMSNVDVANEFTDMIITQRGFQGNSKIITVSDEMLETLINMKR